MLQQLFINSNSKYLIFGCMDSVLTLQQVFVPQFWQVSSVAIQEPASLVDRCKAGERKAQFELYQQYAKAMYNVCLRITNHETEAEDVLQEAFVLAFRKISDFRGESTIGAWLKRIVVNTAINEVRKRRMELAPLDNLRTKEDDTEIVRESEENVFYKVEQVKKAIRELPDGFRVVISLYLLEGYEHHEIAEILGISVSTSKSQYLRAKAKLREILQ
jgi:RNA polymerase sigma-70 factor (ECF subfamily)